MTSALNTVTNIDLTTRIFDSFYDFELVVNTDQYDIVYSYFKDICDTQNIAANFTAILFRIAQELNINTLTLLAEIQGTVTNKAHMNQTMAYYLNSFKSKTSLYGISAVPQPVVPVARNIVQ